MKRRAEASRTGGSWGKVVLSGLVGLGVPLVLRGVSRSGQRSHGSPVTVGAVAGVLGALLGGGFVRRAREQPSLPAPRPAPSQGLKLVPDTEVEHRATREEAPEPRRGPNGRERIWLITGSEAVVHEAEQRRRHLRHREGETAEVEDRGEVRHEEPASPLH